MRVLITSKGKVNIQPAGENGLIKGRERKAMDLPIPAAPPAMRSAGHESSLISSTSDIIDEWSVSRTTVLGVAK